jgi:hypothetical protein
MNIARQTRQGCSRKRFSDGAYQPLGFGRVAEAGRFADQLAPAGILPRRMIMNTHLLPPTSPRCNPRALHGGPLEVLTPNVLAMALQRPTKENQTRRAHGRSE